MRSYNRAIIAIGIASLLSGCSPKEDIHMYCNLKSLNGLDAKVVYIDEAGKMVAKEMVIGRYFVLESHENTFYPELSVRKHLDISGVDRFSSYTSTKFNEMYLTNNGARNLSFKDIDSALEEIAVRENINN